jgi:hypothetical protein
VHASATPGRDLKRDGENLTHRDRGSRVELHLEVRSWIAIDETALTAADVDVVIVA